MSIESGDRVASAINLIRRETPGVKSADILDLLRDLEYLSDQSNPSTLDEWCPSRDTVKEIMSLGVHAASLEFCIKDFVQFARAKGWAPSNNLNLKFILHVKILIGNGRIRAESQ